MRQTGLQATDQEQFLQLYCYNTIDKLNQLKVPTVPCCTYVVGLQGRQSSVKVHKYSALVHITLIFSFLGY